MILGEVDVSAAAMLVTKRLNLGATVRVTTVARLREAGFHVVHSPTRGNPLHVSVHPPSDAEWGDDLARRFNSCFTERAKGRRRK